MNKKGKPAASKENPNPERNEQLQLLADISLHINQMETSTELADFVCQQVKAIIGKGYVGVTLMDEFTQKLSIKALRGLEENKLISAGLRLTGSDPRKIQIPLKDIQPGDMTIYATGRLEIIEGGFYKLFARKYSKAVSIAIERLFNIRFVYAMGFMHDSRHYGGIGILTDSESSIESNRVIIENIVAQAAVIITRIHMQEQLRENDNRFKQVAENADEWIWEVDTEGMYSYCSLVVERILGYKPDELVGKRHFYDLFSPRVREELKEAAFAAFGNKQLIKKLINSNIHKNGKTVVLETNASPKLDEKGNLLGYLGVDTDITERKRAEEMLRQSEEKHRTLFETMVQGVVYQNAEGHIVSANAAAERILGLTLDQMQGRTSTDPRWKAIHEDGSEFPGDTLASMISLRTGEEVQNVIIGVFHPGENEYVWINVNAIPQFKQGETKPYQVYTTFEDITERKHMEEALKKSLAFNETLMNNSPSPIFVTTKDSSIMLVNPAFEVLTGYSNGELIGQKVPYPWWVEESKMEFLKNDQHSRSVLGNFSDEERHHRKKNGEKMWVIMNSRWVSDEQGPLYCINSWLDISARKLAEKALQESEAKYSSLVEKSNDGIIIIENGTLLFVNTKLIEMAGLTHDQVLGRKFIDFSPPEEKTKLMERHLKRMAGENVPEIYETVIMTDDGHLIPIEVNATTAIYQGRPVVMAILRNITDRKQNEAKIIELEALKLANQTKSDLLANVSHELRTPLASIKGNIETLLETDVKWSKKQQMEFLQSANKEADHLTLLIKDLLDMSRIDSGKLNLDKRSYPVKEIIDSASGVLSIIAVKHQLKIASFSDLPPLQADKSRIVQVITNLVENAIKFSPEGSPILIEAKLNTGNVVFSVEDHGIGMPPEVVAKLFDRFYQSYQVVKGKTHGTGLGLSICKGIVEAHGGEIWVESQAGKGSKFNFSIPLTKQ